jgi:HlyD family secretion protein
MITDKTAFMRVGMNGDATVRTDFKPGVLAVPTDAIIEEDSAKYVYIIKDGKAQKVKVETGNVNDTDTEIRTGVAEGDVVITGDQDKIKEGIKVQ